MSDWRSDVLSLEPDAARLVATLEHAPIGIAHVRSDGTFCFVNHYFCAIVDYSPAELMARNITDIAHPLDFANGSAIRNQLYAGIVPTYNRELRLIRKDGSWAWVRIHVKLAPGYDGEAPMLAVVEDVSVRRRAERRLAAQTSVSQILMEAPHFNDAAPLLLSSIGECLDCMFGQLWCIDREKNLLRCTASWHLPEFDPANTESMRAITSFAQSEGIPGVVWARLTPLWLDNIERVVNQRRQPAMLKAGFRSAFAFPIRSANTFFGVFEFFGAQPRSLDDDLMGVLAAFGTQIGEYIERRRAEIAVQARDETLRYQAHLLDTVDQAVMGTDLQGILTYWNRFAETLYGWSAAEALGQPVTIVMPAPLPPHDVERLMERLGRGENWSTEMELQRRDGSRFLAALTDTPVHDADGKMIGIVGVSYDITARKRAEERVLFLDEVSSRLADSLDYAATLAVLVRLTVPRIAEWCAIDVIQDNAIKRVAARHADSSEDAGLQTRAWHYRHAAGSSSPTIPFERTQLYVNDVDGDFARMEDVQPIDGVDMYGSRSVMAAPLIARGRTLGALVFGSQTAPYAADDLDMFDELARRAALAIDNALLYGETQRAVQARDEFLSIAAHELKTPLTTLVGYTQMIERRLTRTREVGERDLNGLRTIMAQADRMSRLMGLLLDVSRIETGHFSLEYAQVDLCTLVQQALEALQPSLSSTAGRPQIDYLCAEDTVHVAGDVLRLEQVVYNLLQNAVKYSPNGGQITITIERQIEYAAVTISDQGIGIPAAAIPHLFDRFYRVDQEGMRSIAGVGIGLYVVREIVERHGGTIDIHSVEGEGSTFTVYLPYRPPSIDDH